MKSVQRQVKGIMDLMSRSFKIIAYLTSYSGRAYSEDRNAVAVMKEGQIVDHIPFNLSTIISLLLRRDVNKALARIAGGKVNTCSRAGYGLEILCVYQFYGPKPYIDKL